MQHPIRLSVLLAPIALALACRSATPVLSDLPLEPATASAARPAAARGGEEARTIQAHPRAPYSRSLRPRLGVAVAGEGLLGEELAAHLSDRLSELGLEVVHDGPVDAEVVVRGIGEKEPGGVSDFESWRFAVRVRAYCRSASTGAKVLLVDRLHAGDGFSVGTDEEARARQVLIPIVEQLAAPLADRVREGDSATVRRTIQVTSVDHRSTLEELVELLFRRGDDIALSGVAASRFEPPCATFDVLVDRRDASRLGAVLSELELTDGTTVEVVQESGTELWIRLNP